MKAAAVIAVVVLAIAGWLFFASQPAPPPMGNGANTTTTGNVSAANANASDAANAVERTALPIAAPANDAASTAFATIRGRCVADEDGHPLADAEVVCTKLDLRERVHADGSFAMRVPIGDGFTLRVTAPDRVMRESDWPMLPADSSEDLGDIRLLRGFVVRGRLVDTAGRPIADMICLMLGLQTPLRAGTAHHVSPSGKADADGTFQLDALLPAGDWPLFVTSADEHRRFYFDSVTAHIDARRGCLPLTIVGRLPQRIRAHVVDEAGQPFADVHLCTEHGGASGTSNERGEIELVGDAAAGSTTRILLDRDTSFDPRFAPPTVAWGDLDAKVVVHRGGTLQVAVVDDQGAPVVEFGIVCAHAEVAAQAPRLAFAPIEHHERGLATLRDVHPGANVLRVQAADPALQATAPTTIAVTGSEREPLRIVLARMQACEVLVATPAGSPVQDSMVTLVQHSGNLRWAKTSAFYPEEASTPLTGDWIVRLAADTTDRDGRARVFAPRDTRGLMLRVVGKHRVPTFLADPALSPSTPLRVVVASTGALHGRVLLHEQGAARFSVCLRDATGGENQLELAADGRFDADSLPIGPTQLIVSHRVAWSQPSSTETAAVPLPGTARTVQVPADGDVEVELDAGVVQFGGARGRVLIDGAIAAGWLVTLCRVDSDARRGMFAIDADGNFTANELLPGHWRAALSRKTTPTAPVVLASELEVHADAETVHDIAFTSRRLVLQLQEPNGAPFAGTLAYVRAGTRSFDAAVARGELTLDPAPEVGIELSRDGDQHWSDPVTMPRDRREHTATVVVPSAR